MNEHSQGLPDSHLIAPKVAAHQASEAISDRSDVEHEKLRQENALLREALVQAARAAGCSVTDNGSIEFLMNVPAAIEASITRQIAVADLRAERQLLARQTDDSTRRGRDPSHAGYQSLSRPAHRR
jgi:hypothetical protein